MQHGFDLSLPLLVGVVPVFQASLFRKAENTEEEEDRVIILIFDPIIMEDDDKITRLFLILFDATEINSRAVVVVAASATAGPCGEDALLDDPLIRDGDGKIIICLSMTWLKDANSYES